MTNLPNLETASSPEEERFSFLANLTLRSIKKDGIPEALQNDVDVAKKVLELAEEASKISPDAHFHILKHFGEEIRDNNEIAFHAMKIDGMNIKFVSQRLKGDRDLVKLAIKTYPRALQDYASPNLRQDKELTMESFRRDGRFYIHNPYFKNDIDCIQVALSNIHAYDAFRNMPEELKSNRDLIKVALTHSGLTLKLIPQEFINDPELVKLAVTQNGLSLVYAGSHIEGDDIGGPRNNEEIVKIAVNQNGEALHFASNRLQDNEEIVKIAVRKSPSALHFASARLKNDPSILALANSSHPNQTTGETARKVSSLLASPSLQ